MRKKYLEDIIYFGGGNLKTRNSYVTNSSSASFILTVKSGVEDLYEFKRVMDDYLKHNVVMVDKYCPPEEYKNKSILQVITENDNKEEKTRFKYLLEKTSSNFR